MLQSMQGANRGGPFTVIGVMREPRDWLGSWYRYRQRPGIPDKRRSTAGMSFDAFVEAYCTEKPPASDAVTIISAPVDVRPDTRGASA